MVERIRTLSARFWQDEETVRDLIARDASFDALCSDYRKVLKLLDGYEAQLKHLTALRALLEEELLTRAEGHQPN